MCIPPRAFGGRRSGHPGAAAFTCADHGQSLVEFAVCLPLLLLVVTGIFTFGVAMNSFLMLTDATNVGARLLAISRGRSTDPCADTANAVYAAAPALRAVSLKFSFVLNGASYSGASCSSPSTTTGAAANLTPNSIVTLTVTYPCNLKVYGADYAPACLLTAQTSELVQ